MNSKEKAKIESKLEFLLRAIEQLQQALPAQRQDYERHRRAQKVVERLCQEIVECCLDINLLIAQRIAHTTPQSGREGFAILRRHEVISEHVQQVFQQSYIGFRNLPVHVYDQIDAVASYYTARRLIFDAQTYVGEIHQFLDAAGDIDVAGDGSA